MEGKRSDVSGENPSSGWRGQEGKITPKWLWQEENRKRGRLGWEGEHHSKEDKVEMK